MALRTPPSWLQNGTHPAENDRLTTHSLIFSTSGVADVGSMRVSQTSTPSMAVSIAAGHAIIPGTQTATQGFYAAYNDGATNLTIATADPSLPRIDRIVVTVQDAFYGGTGNNQVLFQAITGTPASSPVAPAAPNNSITLALVAVAANAASIVNGNITDSRTYAQFNESQITAADTTANSLTINAIASQTGKAVRVNNSSGTQTFAIGVDGTITFPDGSTQTSASTYNPNLTINTQTGTTYTLVLADAQRLITLSNANPITVTVPLNSVVALPVGTQINLSQYGAGQVTIQGASGVTIVSTGATAATPKTRVQYSTLTLVQTSTDNWLAVGDIS